MLNVRGSIVGAALTLALACGTAPPDPDPGPQDDLPVIVEVDPEPGATDFFGGDTLRVWFDPVPDDPSITLADAGGASVAGLLEVADDNSTVSFEPTGDLVASSDYVMTISMAPADDLDIEFTTSRHGEPLDNPEDLLGAVFLIDTSNAEFVEPAVGGNLLKTQLAEAQLLVGFTTDSDLDLVAQPALHFQVAPAVGDGDTLVQDPCSRTASPTFGADGMVPTADDAPASFEDPDLILGPRDISFAVGLLEVSIGDFLFEGTLHPEATGWKGGVIGGTIDTRALDPLLDPDADPGITCDLLEAAGVDCIECGGDTPGAFCLQGRGEGIAGIRVDTAALRTWTCVDVLERFMTDGECEDEAKLWDPDGDGTYPGCPDWTP